MAKENLTLEETEAWKELSRDYRESQRQNKELRSTNDSQRARLIDVTLIKERNTALTREVYDLKKKLKNDESTTAKKA